MLFGIIGIFKFPKFDNLNLVQFLKDDIFNLLRLCQSTIVPNFQNSKFQLVSYFDRST